MSKDTRPAPGEPEEVEQENSRVCRFSSSQVTLWAPLYGSATVRRAHGTIQPES